MIILFALFMAVAPQDYPDHVGAVNDFANEIDAGTKVKIETVIADAKAKADVRLVVVTVPSLVGKSVEDYTIGLTKKWGVGQKGKNNGILFLHAPKERKIRIENGYGVESRLTDIESKMIIENTIIPLMKANKFAEAMLRGSEEILKVLSAPEKQAEKKSAPVSQGSTGGGLGAGGVLMIVGIVAVVLILIFVFVMSSKEISRPPPRTEPRRYTASSSHSTEPPTTLPMEDLATGAMLGTMLGLQGQQGLGGVQGPQGVQGTPGNQPPEPPSVPAAPAGSAFAAAYLDERRRRDEEEERRRRKRRQEEEEEDDNRRRRSSSYDSSSSSSSSYDSGSSSSGSDSFSGGDSGGGGASGEY